MSWKRNSYHDPRAQVTSSNPRLVREFYAFPKPKQDQNLFHTGFPKLKKRNIFESRNPFSGPILQGPDVWTQLQQSNLPTLQGPNVFDGHRLSDFSSFPKKW
jgi:hypothetical protein